MLFEATYQQHGRQILRYFEASCLELAVMAARNAPEQHQPDFTGGPCRLIGMHEVPAKEQSRGDLYMFGTPGVYHTCRTCGCFLQEDKVLCSNCYSEWKENAGV